MDLAVKRGRRGKSLRNRYWRNRGRGRNAKGEEKERGERRKGEEERK